MKYHQPLLPGHIYHIFNHACGSENLFRQADNYSYFLELIIRHIVPVADVYAYNLLPNHFHLLLRIKDEDVLSEYYHIQKKSLPPASINWSKYVMQQFSNCCNAYAKAYNKRFDRRGALFIDYIKRSQISTIDYFCHCVHYIHFNAVHHGLCKRIDEWYWTSYQTCLTSAVTRLDRQVVLKNFEGKEHFIIFHQDKPKIFGDEFEFI